MSKLKIFLSFILTIAVIQGALLGFLRYQIEQQNNTVELVVDYADIEKAAALSNYPIKKFLQDLKLQGITSIAILEQTPAQASSSGLLYFASGRGILRYKNLSSYLKTYIDRDLISPDKTYFLIEDPEVRRRVVGHLQASMESKKIKFLGRNIIEIDEKESQLRDLGIGFSEADLKELAEFYIIARLGNNPKYNIRQKIALLKDFDTVVFEGEEILGFPDKLPKLSEALKMNKIKFGHVEIIKQFGNTGLKKLMGNDLIRVHSISKDELKKVDKNVAVDRFARAVKERGVRMLYLRPYLSPKTTATPTVYNIIYFSNIRRAIENAGFRIGKASYPQEFSLTQRPVLILGMGVVVGFIMLLDAFFKLNLITTLIIILLSVLGLYSFGPQNLNLQQLLALGAAIIFPAVAVINGFSKPLALKNLYSGAAVMVVNVIFEALLGAVIIVGLLCDTRFMLGAEAFRGVKLALLLPILIVAFYFFVKGDQEQLNLKKLKERVRSYLNITIPISYLLISSFILFGFFVLLARSGNFIIPVLKVEKLFRSLLENILVVRPRFKEFMIGYPALFLSAVLFIKGQRRWLWVLLAIGTLAPVSLVNSFSHIHTPLSISIIRSVNGLIIGVIFGVILSFLVNRNRDFSLRFPNKKS